MKKISMVSLVALFAAAPMMAEAARSIEKNENVTATANTQVATTSYVKGAYNAVNSQVNALIDDTAVAAREGGYKAIVAGNKVSENLIALDSAISGLGTSTIGDMDGLTGAAADSSITTLVGAINTKQDQLKAGTDNIQTAVKTATGTNAVTAFSSTAVTNASDSSLVTEKAIMKVMEDARATSINSNVNSASDYKLATEKAVSSAISNAAGNASYSNESMDGITTISGAIDNLDTRLDSAESSITTLTGGASTEGSVAKAEADAKAYAKAYADSAYLTVYTTWDTETSAVVDIANSYVAQ